MFRLMKFSPMRILLVGYCAIILLGSVLLSLPASARAGEWTAFSDAFFTAASAACVTGLVRFDTWSHWSLFGQLVILTLIQVGGLGFVTITLFSIMCTGQKIGLSSRVLMREAVSAPQVGGILRMTRFILLGTLVIEAAGALLLAVYFCPRLGPANGIYYAVFHSISAFCNAGFDLMGYREPFSSLTIEGQSAYVQLVIMGLIVIGGLGFFVWRDLLDSRFRFSRLRLHSKLVLTATALLIFGGAAAIFALESRGNGFAGMSAGERTLASLFQSVTVRTAGFNSVDLTKLSEGSIFWMICLMLIGGSTGSTAGGIKTTTVMVLLLSIFTTFKKKKNIEIFGRRLEDDITRTASCIFMMYLTLLVVSTLVISAVEGLPVLTVLFETTSAAATVGLTLGITPGLSMLSKLILAFLMIFGRAGSLTMLLAFSADRVPAASTKPLEKIQMG
ncbi:MAG: Trk family potassium uptake protein [Lachnospiraceae bacterium]|jgi:trk system potassium uptake protein TrkH|nr:Trk family potassium uptake protein [Lachnospiraceae bacterium]